MQKRNIVIGVEVVVLAIGCTRFGRRYYSSIRQFPGGSAMALVEKAPMPIIGFAFDAD
jgi:hypothetical protein